MEGSEAMDNKDLVWQSVQSDQTYPADGPFSSPPAEDEGILPASCIKQEVITHTDDGCPTSTVVTDGSVGSIQVKEEPPYALNEDQYAASHWPDGSASYQQTVDAPYVRNTPYMCFTCGAEFQSLSDVQTHSYAHTYRIGETVFSPITNIKSMSEKSKSTKLQECSLCGIKVKDQVTLDIHVRENHTCKKVHTCSTCGKGFLNVKNLNIHVSRHSKLKYNHACSYCTKVFSTTFELGAHMDIHNGLKPHVCLVCNEGFAYLPELHSHPNNQKDEPPYKCEECGEAFTAKLHLRRHDYVHTGKLPHPCPRCGKGFWSLSEVIKHKRIYHSNPHKCAICGRGYMAESGLISHIKYTHENSKEAPREPTPQPQAIKSKPKCESKYNCEVCGQGFMRENVLQRHSTTHKEQKYVCTLCGKYFLSESSLRLHSFTHKRKLTRSCNLCGTKLKDDNAVISHKRKHHSCNKYVRCSMCGQGFETELELDEHLLKHSRGEAHKCIECDMQFCLKSELDNHINFHAGKTPYECNICRERFMAESSLKAHTFINEVAHSCTECGMGFRTLRKLETHMYTHTQEKPYTCSICKTGFWAQTNLKKHIMKHVDPYKCSFCGVSFKAKRQLNKHIIKHTSHIKCSVCGIGFPNEKYLKHHVKFLCAKLREKAQSVANNVSPAVETQAFAESAIKEEKVDSQVVQESDMSTDQLKNACPVWHICKWS